MACEAPLPTTPEVVAAINDNAPAATLDADPAREEHLMARARFRFYEELNDFLPPQRRKVSFDLAFDRRASIKDMIEALGVPHPEIELIVVNGESVGFDHLVRDGDRVAVYPVFEAIDVSNAVRLREQPLRRSRFVLDVQLGKLSRYLRLCGFDTLYRNDYDDADVATIAAEESRILLTRDRDVLKRRIVTHGYFVRSDRPRTQVGEVLRRFDLHDDVAPFTRCSRCNGPLHDIDKAQGPSDS
jgi:sulfur carrier protein ThiS